MHVTPQNHPSPEQLAAFNSGRLNAVESDDIERHLAECPACCEALLGIPDDTLVALLRDEDTTAAVSIAPTVAPEAQQATQWHVSAATQPEAEAPAAGELPPELRDHSRYRILERVGRGGMGDVYKAEHKVMDRLVALKVIKPHLVQSDAAVRRFRREVQAAARLHHPHIVTAYDAEQAGDLHYLVMEFVDGVSLDEVVQRRGPLPIEEACGYIRQAALALEHAHELGMIHRDIKPHNLMLSTSRLPGGTSFGVDDGSSAPPEEGPARQSGPTLKVLDFGLAGFVNETAVEEIERHDPQRPAPAADVLMQLTQMGVTMGTPDYIAPEQARDAHTADIRSDIYSLGCTFYNLLTGRTPFGGSSVIEKIRAHTEQDPPPLRSLRPELPQDLEAIVLKMMAKDPALRYQTPAEVAEALQQFIDDRVEAILRERGFHSPPPAKPIATGGDDVSDWYAMVADTMRLGVAYANIVFSLFVTALIVWLQSRGTAEGEGFARNPLTLLVVWSFVPGVLLLPVVPKVQRMEGYGWMLLAVLLCMVPSVAIILGFPLGCHVLWRLLQPRYREPLGAASRLSFLGGTAFALMLLFPFAVTAAGVVVYVELGKTTVKFEIEDPTLEVRFAGETITVENDGQPIRIQPHDEQHVLVQRGDSQAQAASFTLNKGDKVVLRVAVVTGNPRIIPSPRGDALALKQQRIHEPGPPEPESVRPQASSPADLVLQHKLGPTEIAALPSALAASADGRWLITAEGSSKSARLWDASTGKPVFTMPTEGARAQSVAISRDGTWAAVFVTVTKDFPGRVDIWNLAERKKVRQVSLRYNHHIVMSFSADGRRLVTGGQFGAPDEVTPTFVWDIATGDQVHRHVFRNGFAVDCKAIPGTNDVILAVATAGDTNSGLLTGGRLWQWNVESGQLTRPAGFPESGHGFDISSDGSRAAVVAVETTGLNPIRQNYSLEVRDLRTGELIQRLETGVNERPAPVTVCFLGGDRFVAASYLLKADDQDSSGAIRVWDVPTGRLVAQRPGSGRWMYTTVVPLADGSLAAFGLRDLSQPAENDIEIWQLPESVWPRSVDLLARINPAQHALDGGVSKENGILYTPRGGQNTVVMIPYRPEPQEEYDIRLVAEKTDSEGNGLNLGLVMGGRQAHLAMGGGGKKAAWCVEMIDGKSMHNENVTCVDGLPWPLNQKVSVLMQVRQHGVRVLRDGTEIINWQGRPEQLSLWDRIVLPDRLSLFFFSQAKFAIHELTLIPAGSTTSEVVEQLPESVWPREAEDDRPVRLSGDPMIDNLLKDALAVYTFEEETFFREDGRMRVRDVSGKEHDASVEDEKIAYSAEGQAGGALACNRKAASLPDFSLPAAKLRLPAALLSGRDEYTLALWVRDSGKPTTPSGKSVRTLFQEGFPKGTDAVFPLSVNFAEQRVRAFNLGDLVEAPPVAPLPLIEASTPDATIPKDQWFFLVLTLVKQNGAHVLRITIDEKTFEQPFASIPEKPQDGFGLTGGIDGLIDELAFFSRALTDDELAKLREHGRAGNPLLVSQTETAGDAR